MIHKTPLVSLLQMNRHNGYFTKPMRLRIVA